MKTLEEKFEKMFEQYTPEEIAVELFDFLVTGTPASRADKFRVAFNAKCSGWRRKYPQSTFRFGWK